ncbi:MAG: oligosaccharide flippase family protein, partial [Crenarchaeota archaeon]|nr:oligosaccharide flippase family protein [Thermoproteota archaeon]
SPLISSCYDTTELIWPLRVLGLLLFLNAINSIQTALYSRRMEFKKIFIRSIISVPLSGIVGIVLALQGFGLWALVIHNILNVLIIIIVMAFDKNCRLGLKFSISRFKKLLPFSGKIILTGAVTGGGDFLRTLIIGKKYNTEDLAYYDKAYTYSNYATQIVGLSITSVMLPSFSREQNNPNSLKKMARASIRLSTFIMFPVLLGFASIAKPFVLILLTKKWEASIPFLIIFCLLRMPAFISNIDKQVYYAIGKSGISLVYECVLLVLNIVSLLISVQYGVIYIALGAMIVEWVGCMIIWWISNRAYGYTLKERMTDIAKPLMNSVVMFAASYSIQLIDLKLYLSLILQIFVGIIVYCVMSSLTKDRNIKDIISFIKAKKRKTND